MPAASAPDPVYDEVAAFLATLVAGGVRHVVLSPGSRSTPLTVCAAAQPDLTHWMQFDERTAAFFALGIAKVTNAPVALICTSGTAAANYFPAVIEASRTGVPLVVLSADRPPELHGGWGANQTIDQHHLFGSYPRLFHQMPVGGSSNPQAVSDMAATVLQAAAGPTMVGPVHVNWPFRKPLEPVADVPVCHLGAENLPQPEMADSLGDASSVDRLATLASKRGVIVAGPQDSSEWSAAIGTFAERVGWPILAEATSQLRLCEPSPNSISFSERFLLHANVADALAPEVVLFSGATPTGTSALQWAEQHGAHQALLISPAAPWRDAGSVDAEPLLLRPEQLLSVAAGVANSQSDHGSWLEQWQKIDTDAERVVAREDTAEFPTGPCVARTVARHLRAGSHLLVANSMSVRDLDRYVPARSGIRVHVSRGASGIDGLIATASGLAAGSGEPVTLLIGDIAFLHDVGSLLAAARLGTNVTIVVVNDDGGGIFSMLPIAQRGSDVNFHELFHTPHGTDLAAVDGFDGVTYQRISSTAALAEAIAAPATAAKSDPIRVIEVPINHDDNMAARAKIDEELGRLAL